MKQSLSAMIFVLAFAAGCGTPTPVMDAGQEKPDTTCDANPEAVTMASLQTDIFQSKCASCHFPPNGSGIAYGDFTTATNTYNAMVNKKSLYAASAGTLMVVDTMSATTAEKLANSSLWLKVSTMKTNGFRGPKNENTGLRMPNDGTPLSAAEMKKIKDWICRGAPM